MRLLLCAALFLAVPYLALPAPIPRERKASGLYHPTRKGDKLVYEYRSGGDVLREETLIVTAVEEKDECKIVSVGCEKADKVVARWKVSVSERGLDVLTQLGKTYDPPTRLVKLPAKVGDKWESESERWTVGAIEKLEVPAGTYTAIRVDWEWLEEEDERPKRKFWYAPEVGLVKMETGERTVVLKSFTPATK